MTDLRSMEIPENRMGLSEGLWLRWPELEAFLTEQQLPDIVLLIQDMLDGKPLEQREVTIRR